MKKWMALFLICISFASAHTAEEWEADWQQYKARSLIYQQNQDFVEGWCSKQKASLIMDLIYHAQPKVCVEIGVYGGSSAYPMLAALHYVESRGGSQRGVVYAIDPWSVNECLEGYKPEDPNYNFWSNKENMERIYYKFLRMLRNTNLEPFCKVMRMPSARALQHLPDEPIDILHIDGNHTEEAAYHDASCYFDKVRKGGYIIVDDIKWSTVDGKKTLQKAYSFLQQNCDIVEVIDEGTGCAFLQKR